MIKNQRTENKQNFIKKEIQNKLEFNIVQIGRIDAWKKIHIVIDALITINANYPKIMKLIKFNIIGISQDKEYEEKLLNKINSNNLSNNIFFDKDLEYDAIEKKLQNSDLSISLTAYNPIIESLQNGVPVITYEYGEVSDIFKDCQAVFIVAKNIKKSTLLSMKEEKQIQDELEEKIIELYYKKDKLSAVGKNGKLFVENNFPNINQHSKEICDIYQNILSKT